MLKTEADSVSVGGSVETSATVAPTDKGANMVVVVELVGTAVPREMGMAATKVADPTALL